MDMEAEPLPTAGTFVKPQSTHDTVVPTTSSSPNDDSNHSALDQPCSSSFEADPHPKSNRDTGLSLLASVGSGNQQDEPSVTVGDQFHSQTFSSPPSVKSEKEATTSRELTLHVSDQNLVDAHVVAAYGGLQQRQGPESSLQATYSDHREAGPLRSSVDGYNWRKYGQKHIKGNDFPRSYYKCSHPNCQVRKQVERSHNGSITDVCYKGHHDHPKPQFSNQMSSSTFPVIQEERSNRGSLSSNAEGKSSNGHGQTSPKPKPNSAPGLSLVLDSDNNVEDTGEKLVRVRDGVENNNDQESKRRRLKFNTYSSEQSIDQRETSVQAEEDRSQSIVLTNSIASVDAAVSSHELTLSVVVPNSSVDIVDSGAIVPFGVDLDAPGHRSDSGQRAMRSDHKGTTRFVTAERLWGDGYNWRKYGQKQIKGSEFPRSYYRCTYPNCQMKKQLERSHDGQVTEIIYKGEHNHPKPQPSSHMAVGRILSIQEEGPDRFSSSNCTDDKLSNGHSQLTQPLELNRVPQVSLLTATDNDVQGEGSKPNQTDEKIENDNDPESNHKHLKVNMETSNNAAADSNDKQGEASVEVGGRHQSTLVSSPSTKNNTIDASSHDMTPSTTISNPPVYMVTSRGIVPVEVESDESRQRHGSDNGVQAAQADHNEISIAMTERLLENAYHWRKYGQKNIKGSEFPRSYYRCTHPSCQVKMQLERSHDGRIIEIIYKGKHEHPKPQPLSRMAIGAILSLEEENSDKFSLNSPEEKPSNGHTQTSLYANSTGTPELSLVTASDVSKRNQDEVGNENDSEFKHRDREAGDADFTQVVRVPKEPRIVVETLSEFDVVDDGYRWQKYGRKMVKGNPNPRNYYRCSNAACTVKKHVERATHNPKALITTYEGKHNHDLPPPRISGQDIVQKVDSSVTLVSRYGDDDTISLDAGIATSSVTEAISNEKQDIMDIEPLQSQCESSDPDCTKLIERNILTKHIDDLTETGDQDRSKNDKGEGFSFHTPPLNHSSNPDVESQ